MKKRCLFIDIFLTYYIFLLLNIQTTIPVNIVNIGTTNIIVFIITSSWSVTVYFSVSFVFLIVIVSSLSVKCEIEFKITSLLLYNSLA